MRGLPMILGNRTIEPLTMWERSRVKQTSTMTKLLKPNETVCDYCREIIEEEEAHEIHAGDESVTMCETCYDHYH